MYDVGSDLTDPVFIDDIVSHLYVQRRIDLLGVLESFYTFSTDSML
jgi:hypothetical protein